MKGPALASVGAQKNGRLPFADAPARDLGPSGVTVNNVQPGPIDTDMNPADGPMAESQKKLTSVGRFGKPEEIAAAVAFLARPDAAFINGESLNVDGGWNA